MKTNKYIIVGDNNFWYSTTGLITAKELIAEIAQIKKDVQAGFYGHDARPNELFAYECTGGKVDFKVTGRSKK